MKTIRWGMIGTGSVAEIKSGPALYKAAGSELVAVMSPNAERVKSFAHRHKVARWTTDADKLINDPEVEIIYIATPPHLHMEYALRILEAGKMVYCEKPMALSYEDCLTMIAKSKEKNIPLWVGYYRRALPRFKKIKEIVDSGQIGDVRSVRVNLYKHIVTDPENIAWRFMPEISGGGIFVDMGSHTLDFLDYVLGPINEAHGIAVNQLDDYPAEDNVSAVFRFANGAIGTGNWCFSTEHELDQTELIGTKGSVAFASFSVRPIELTVNGETSLIKIPDPEHVHQPLVETILSEIGGTGICPSSGVSAARTNWVVDQILKNNSNA